MHYVSQLMFLKNNVISQIYSAGVSVFLGGNKPSRNGNIRGDISVNFSCDPEISSTLVSFFFFTHLSNQVCVLRSESLYR